MNDGKSMGSPNTQGPGGGGQDYNGNPLGGGMGVQYQSGGPGPQKGFGFDPTNDMPFTGQAPVGIQGNQPAPNTLPAPGTSGGKSSPFNKTPPPNMTPEQQRAYQWQNRMTMEYDPQMDQQARETMQGYYDQNPDYRPGFNPGPGQQNPNIQKGFGPAGKPIFGQGPDFISGGPAIKMDPTLFDANGQLKGDLFRNVTPNYNPAFTNEQMRNIGNQQPANRFIPPNAPGVRPGIPVQSARTVTPGMKQFTRTRIR